MTIWVDPGEVFLQVRRAQRSFCVMQLQSCHQADKEFSRRIHNAVERAASDIQSGSSSDEEGGDTSMGSSCSSLSAPCPAPNPKPKTIPTVSNPNSVYQFSEFALVPPPPAWAAYSNRKAFPGEGYPHGPPSGGLFAQQHSSQFQPPKGFKPYRATSSFTGPRQDKYHWVSKNRS
nr:maternal B9.15 protein-like isoform X2 [Salvelinus alpinus]